MHTCKVKVQRSLGSKVAVFVAAFPTFLNYKTPFSCNRCKYFSELLFHGVTFRTCWPRIEKTNHCHKMKLHGVGILDGCHLTIMEKTLAIPNEKMRISKGLKVYLSSR